MVRDVGLASAGDLDEMAGAELLGRQSLDDRRPDRVAEYSDEVAIEAGVSSGAQDVAFAVVGSSSMRSSWTLASMSSRIARTASRSAPTGRPAPS